MVQKEIKQNISNTYKAVKRKEWSSRDCIYLRPANSYNRG